MFSSSCYVYILSLSDGKFYCGITNDINRRFNEHKFKKSSWASKVGVVKLVWSELLESRTQARKREVYIKNFGVSRYVKYLRLNNKLK